jgi:hypothetical protein
MTNLKRKLVFVVSILVIVILGVAALEVEAQSQKVRSDTAKNSIQNIH